MLILLSLLPFSASAKELVLVASEADASVSEVTRVEGTERETVLGKTPYTVADVDTSADHVYKIEKAGFSPVYVPVLHSTSADSRIKVVLRSHANWIPEDAARRASAIAEQQIEDIFNVQLLLDQKKNGEALAKAEDLKRQYPASVGVQLVYANALLLNGQRDRAVTLYTALAQELPESKASLKSSLQALVQKLSRGKK